jgi:hypothetical protein
VLLSGLSVAGKEFNRYSGDDLAIALQQLLSGFDQGIVVVGHVADGAAFELEASVLPLAFGALFFPGEMWAQLCGVGVYVLCPHDLGGDAEESPQSR